MVKLPGPSISGLSFSVRSVYSWVVVEPTTPMVSYRFESGRAAEAEDRERDRCESILDTHLPLLLCQRGQWTQVQRKGKRKWMGKHVDGGA